MTSIKNGYCRLLHTTTNSTVDVGVRNLMSKPCQHKARDNVKAQTQSPHPIMQQNATEVSPQGVHPSVCCRESDPNAHLNKNLAEKAHSGYNLGPITAAFVRSLPQHCESTPKPSQLPMLLKSIWACLYGRNTVSEATTDQATPPKLMSTAQHKDKLRHSTTWQVCISLASGAMQTPICLSCCCCGWSAIH